jgi:hypothetical protein
VNSECKEKKTDDDQDDSDTGGGGKEDSYGGADIKSSLGTASKST